MIGHYRDEHPRGKKFRPEELKARREQVFEEQTRHLVPQIAFRVEADDRELPFARFVAKNLGNYPPVKALLSLTVFGDGKNLGPVIGSHYRGEFPVNLNPGHGFNGYFVLPLAKGSATKPPFQVLLVKVDVTIIDPYEREHRLLPFGFVYVPPKGQQKAQWYYEPSPEVDQILRVSSDTLRHMVPPQKAKRPLDGP